MDKVLDKPLDSGPKCGRNAFDPRPSEASVTDLVRRGVRRPLRFWRHPLSAIRGLLRRGRYPTPEQIDQMTPHDFDTYVRDIGFDARIRSAVAESNARGISADPDPGVSVGSGRP